MILLYIIAFIYFLTLIYFIDTSLVEGFNSHTSCIKQGYDKDFCLNSPFDPCVNCHLELKDKFIQKRFYTYSA